MKQTAVVVLLLLATAPVFAEKSSTCPDEWRIGTLAMLSTGEPPEVSLVFVDPGKGDDIDVCLPHPEWCQTIACAITSGPECMQAASPRCYRYLVEDCECDDKPPVIREFVEIATTPCP